MIDAEESVKHTALQRFDHDGGWSPFRLIYEDVIPRQPFRFQYAVPLFASGIRQMVWFQKAPENPQLKLVIQGEALFLRPFKYRFPVALYLENAVVAFYEFESCVVAVQPTC